MGERQACFPLNLPKPHLAWVRSKMASYSKTATRQQFDWSVAEDLRIAFLQSNLFLAG